MVDGELGARLDLRLPAGLRDRLEAAARADRRPVTSFARLLLEEALDAREGLPPAGTRVRRLIDAGPGGLPVAEALAPASAARSPYALDGHLFTPQAGNALKCETCGGKKGDHRG